MLNKSIIQSAWVSLTIRAQMDTNVFFLELWCWVSCMFNFLLCSFITGRTSRYFVKCSSLKSTGKNLSTTSPYCRVIFTDGIVPFSPLHPHLRNTFAIQIFSHIFFETPFLAIFYFSIYYHIFNSTKNFLKK